MKLPSSLVFTEIFCQLPLTREYVAKVTSVKAKLLTPKVRQCGLLMWHTNRHVDRQWRQACRMSFVWRRLNQSRTLNHKASRHLHVLSLFLLSWVLIMKIRLDLFEKSRINEQQQSARQLRQRLHWLPARARTDFKLATLAFQSRAKGQPDYLAVELHPHKPQRCLHSSSQELLTVPNCKTMLGSRRFSVAAPRVWNCLPLDLKTDCNSLRGVKSSLSTYLLRRDCI